MSGIEFSIDSGLWLLERTLSAQMRKSSLKLNVNLYLYELCVL